MSTTHRDLGRFRRDSPAAPRSSIGARHLDALRGALDVLELELERLDRWGRRLHDALSGGGRLLVCGNGGSAAEAQHLTAELVGRYRTDRAPFSALCLSADSSATTAIGNDYGIEEVFARQVTAHGRPGDVLLALSTSGRSPNVVAAATAAQAAGMEAWALTGPGPNPLAQASDDALCVGDAGTATVQEAHLVAVHLLCEAFDHCVACA